jgi:hypothetical protein
VIRSFALLPSRTGILLREESMAEIVEMNEARDPLCVGLFDSSAGAARSQGLAQPIKRLGPGGL